MRDIHSEKKLIKSVLSESIIKNEFVDDIWIYGNFEDKVSDLDLIVVYKKKPRKLIFPRFIKRLVADGTVIYIDYHLRKDIFLFDDIKVFSVKNNKKIHFQMRNSYKKFRFLCSFVERYYERKSLLQNNKISILNDSNLRNLKSILFCYENFIKFNSISQLRKDFIRIEKKYKVLRKNFNQKSLKSSKYKNYTQELNIFDRNFYNISFKVLDNLFPDSNIPNFHFKFKNKILFSNKKSSSKKIIKVPNIFFYVFFYYACQKLKISKLLFNDFKIEKKSRINFSQILSQTFITYLQKKIKFVEKNYLTLKKNNFKTGLYRFSWYLNN